MLGFYSALLSGISAPQALTATKRRYLANEETSSDLNWSSFQIYIK
jgi:hypothetical protein